MRKNRTRRITSTVLSVAMTAVSVLGDATIPILAADGKDTGQTASVSGLVSSVTSDYLKNNLNGEVGREVSEYTVQDIEEQSYTADTQEESSESSTVLPVTGGSTRAAFAPKISKIALKAVPSENDAGIANSDLEAVQTQTVFDENGLAATYHYVLLNYSLVEESAVTADTAMDDVWENTPESFIVSIPTYTNVYALEGHEDYFIAFADPSVINGTGKATYADFTDFDTVQPTIYNDVVTFDAESGIIYIPKAFYYNADGQEIIKELQAQVLVPYSFESVNSQVNVQIDCTADVSVKTGSFCISTAALDVSMTVPVAKENTTGLDDTSFKVYLNDDPLETTGIASYDAQTGQLTIAVNPATIYAMRIEVSNPEETVLSEALDREILLASTEDIPLGDVLLAADSYEHVTSAAAMTEIPEAAFSMTYDQVAAGDLFIYPGAFTYCGNPVKGTTEYSVIKATAKYCYYANDEAQQQSEYTGIKSGATLNTFTTAGHDIVRRPDLTEGGAAFSLFNVLTTLPKGALTSTKPSGDSASTSGHEVTFTTNLSKLSGYPSDTSGTKNNTLVALHCAHITNGIESDNIEGAFSLAQLYCRVLYVHTSASESYAVLGIITPCVGLDGKSQAGSGMYKVRITKDKVDKYYARFNIQKNDSSSQAQLGDAYYIATIEDKDYLDYVAEYLTEQLSTMPEGIRMSNLETIVSSMAKVSGARTYTGNLDGFIFSWDETEGMDQTVYVREYIAPDGYALDDTIYTIKVTGSKDRRDGGTITSVSSSKSGEYPVTFTKGALDTISVLEYETPYYAAFNLEKVSTLNGTGVPNAVYAVLTGGSMSDEEAISMALKMQAQAVASADKKSSAAAKCQAAVASAYKSSAASLGLVGFIRTGSDGSGQIYKYNASTSALSTKTHALIQCDSDNPTRVLLVEILSPDDYALNENVLMFYVKPNGNKSTTYDAAVKATTIVLNGDEKPFAGASGTASNQWNALAGVSGNNTVSKLKVTVKEHAYLYGAFGIKKVDDDGKPVGGLRFDIYTGYSDGRLSGKLDSGITTDINGFGVLDVSEIAAKTSAGISIPKGSWTSGQGTDKVFYVRENRTSAQEKNLVWNDTVYKVVVRGKTGSADGASIAVTDAANGTAVETVQNTENTGLQYFYFTQINEHVTVYGKFGILKIDSKTGEAVRVKGIHFNVYTDQACTKAAPTAYIETDEDGIADYPEFHWKLLGDGSNNTVTYYIREEAASVPNGYTVNPYVYKVVITGSAESADKCSIKVYRGETGAAASEELSSGDVDNNQNIRFKFENTRRVFYGKIVLTKYDQATEQTVEGVTFDFYTDDACTDRYEDRNGRASCTTDQNGTLTWALEWDADDDAANSTRTVYVRENADSAKALGLEPDTNVYRAVITGSDEAASMCSVELSRVSGNYEPQIRVADESTYVLKAYNKPVKSHTVKKQFTSSYGTDSEDMVSAIDVQLYKTDASGNKTEAVGDAVTLTKAGGWTYTWEQLPYYTADNRTEQFYTVEEVAVRTTAGEGNCIANTDVTYDRTGDLTGITCIDNQAVQLYGRFELEKIDDLGRPVEGIRFNIVSATQISGDYKASTSALSEVTTTDADGHLVLQSELVDASIITDEAGAAVYVLSQPWYEVSAKTWVLYVQEDQNNAYYHADPNIYRIVVTGTRDSEMRSCSFSTENLTGYEQMYLGKANADENVNTASGDKLIITNDRVRLFGMLSLKKDNGVYTEDGDTVSLEYIEGAQFEIYADESLSTDSYVTTIFTDQEGYAEFRFSTALQTEYNDWMLACGASGEDRTSVGSYEKTLYLKEVDNDRMHSLFPFVIKAVVKGVRDDAGYATIQEAEEHCTVTYEILETDEAVEAWSAYLGYDHLVHQEHSNQLRVSDLPLALNVDKKDFDSGEYLKGATLSVYEVATKADGSYELDEYGNPVHGKRIAQWVSDGTTHQVRGMTLTWSTPEDPYIYVLAEETGVNENGSYNTPDGYITADDIPFIITSDNHIVRLDNENLSADTYSDNNVTVWNRSAKIRITKTDASDEWKELSVAYGVSGAYMQLYYVDESGHEILKCAWWTVAGEAFEVDNCRTGTYRLYEDCAPAGFATYDNGNAEGPTNYYEFTVEQQLPVGETIQDFEMEEQNIRVKVEKIDPDYPDVYVQGAILSINNPVYNADGTLAVNADGSYKTNGVLTYTPQNSRVNTVDGVVTCRWVTSAEEMIFYEIPAGTYILKELTAPTERGYVLAKDMVITIADTAEWQIFEMEEDHTEVAVSKVDTATKEPVAGAVLSIYSIRTDENGAYVVNADGTYALGDVLTYSYPDGAVQTCTMTTAADIIRLEYIPAGTYVLHEDVTPAGYATAPDLVFTVDAVGQKEVQDVKLNNAYEVCDQPLTVSISKTDITSGEEIEGAHLQILRAVQDENGDWTADGSIYTTIKGEVCDWISGTDGKDEAGNLLPHDILYIEAGTYILHEVTAPTEQGYVKVSDIVFEIIDTEAVQKVEMQDEITRVHISKKNLTDGREIPGAKLTIYVKNPDGTRGKAVYSWTTDGTPYEIEHIPVGDYILEEVAAPDRYQRAEAVEFTVTETGEIQKVEMFDDRTYGKAEVYKSDEDGNPVAGAEFVITRADTGEVVDVITTDENGYAISRELPIDELRSITQDALTGEPVSIIYTITETFAPAGVVLDCTPEAFQFCYADDETPVVTTTFSKVNQHQQGRIAVIKKGLAVIGTEKVETRYGNVDKLVFGYVYLPGVEFTVYADRELTEVVTTVTTGSASVGDRDGYGISEYIDVGTYYIVETKTPAGYKKDDTVYELTITGISQREDAIEYVLDVTKEIENHLCSSTLNIYKIGTDLTGEASSKDREAMIPLEGVYFGVYANEDIRNILGDVVVQKGDCMAIIKTNSEGIASMTENLPAGAYYYKELKTLDQFVLDETRYEFTVSLANDNVVIDINKTNPLVNHAKYGKLTVHKVDQDGNPIGAGAVFALTNLETGETWTLTTDETSTISIDGLPIGRFNENGKFIYYNYELEEIQAPDNYRLPENESDRIINFTFSADSNEADALSVSFTVKNVILGINDFSMAGGVTMLLMAVAMMVAAFRKRKELAV